MSLKQKILELGKQGYSYNKIVEKLDCAKSTVSYHLGEGQKNKTKQRQIKNRKENPLNTKRARFLENVKCSGRVGSKETNVRKIIKIKREHFSRTEKNGGNNYMFSIDELIEHIGDNPKCYLTGKEIDLSKSSSYSLDHIVPRSKGGDNSLENCGLACREANEAKSDQNLEDFIDMCQAVVNHLKK